MRARTAAEAQALGELCGNIMALTTAAYVTWSTVIAFAGGTIPLTHWHIGGGAGAGLLWMCIVDPLVVSIALVALDLLRWLRSRREEARGSSALLATFPWAMAVVVLVDALALEPRGIRWLPADRVADSAWLATALDRPAAALRS